MRCRSWLLWLMIGLTILVFGACTEPTLRRPVGGIGQTEAEPNVQEEPAPSSVEIALEPLVGDLNRPLWLTHAADASNRLFIVEQAGIIWIWQDDALVAEPFLDIREEVNDRSNEQGLLGLAFPPNFGMTGHFFVNYTDASGATMISRFQVSDTNSNQADASSQFTILQIAQPAQNHNGGMLAFGPDGYLYIGTGDGGASNDRFKNGQNPNSLLGKMLRLDVTSDPLQPYLVPADNPFITDDWTTTTGETVDVLDEVISVGLRNPWRYSFDRVTGDLWIADVGQNQYEEVNFVGADQLASGAVQGLNFGWPIMEAGFCFQSDTCSSEGLVLPVSEYDHSGHCSVTGGYVYRGESYPALNGIYLYADYCSGVIWAVVGSPSGTWDTVEILKANERVSSFGEDEQGELYLTTFGGTVYRIVAN
ncbi:MAG: PQQ-dependent sugar dehydrogenase [Chloroflexota bacterium]